MSTREDTIAFLLDQLSALPGVRSRKMFGEYCLYFDEKPVAFVCDDELFVKPTEEGRAYVLEAGAFDEAPAYPGSKLYLRVSGDRWEDREWLTGLLELTASVLPAPKPKKPKPKKSASKTPGSKKPQSKATSEGPK